MTDEQFFTTVSINSGVDPRTVRNVFYGMVKTMSRELRARREVELPDWGKFVLKIQKSKEIIDVNERTRRMIPATPMVKFKPDYKVKKYFQSLAEGETVI